MIKLDKSYSDYTDETDEAYPAGKAVDATTEESIDGTPYLKKWMNNIHGAFTALWVKAFGSVEGMSGQPDSVDDSDILLAVEKLIETPLTLHSDTRGANAHGATIAATPGQIVLRDQVGRAKVAAPVEGDDIARKEEVDAEAEARISAVTAEAEARINAVAAEATARIAALTTEENARVNADNALQHNINLANNARLSGDNALSGRITSNDTDIASINMKITSLQNFSTSYEVATGQLWDGRMIYRRCWNNNSHINIGTYRAITQIRGCYSTGDIVTQNYGADSPNMQQMFPIYNPSNGSVYLQVENWSVSGTGLVEYYK